MKRDKKKDVSDESEKTKDQVRGEVRPIRYERPEERPKPTPTPPKKEN